MNNLDQVAALIKQFEAEGMPKPDSVRQIALACLGWPYVFGAWGEQCTPANRKRRARSDHPTIVSKCPALSEGRPCDAADCKWGIGVRMYDCRGFTRWLLQQVGLDITGQGATSQYNTADNWLRRGTIDQMPDCVCCVFRKKGSSMEHTGMHVGGGVVVDCSVNVRSIGMSGWTHYAIPKGLYKEGEIPTTTIKPTLRKGAEGDLVRELQERLDSLGYDCGKADGKFGAKTKAAVERFQKDRGLTADGIVGAKTWKALDEDRDQDPTYKVTCYGVNWDNYLKIREICPTAEAVKEG